MGFLLYFLLKTLANSSTSLDDLQVITDAIKYHKADIV